MDNLQYSFDPNASSNFDIDSFTVQGAPLICQNYLSNDQMASIQEKSHEHVQDAKYTMQSLCKSFLKKYANTVVAFEPACLATQFNAKLRRVYDMTNILEGGGIIQKVEKGTYKWKGPNNNCKQLIIERNDWCSLRNISSGLKSLFQLNQKGFTCHDLYGILTKGKKNKFNPATVRRRIYECCKVFLIVELIQKFGKTFYNGKLSVKDIRLLMQKKCEEQVNIDFNKNNIQIVESQAKNEDMIENEQDQTKKESLQDLRKYSTVLQQRKSIIRKIVNQFKTESDLHRFIEDLNQEFKTKNLSTDQESQDAKLLEENESSDLRIETWTQININKEKKSCDDIYHSPQVYKNIIVSSPLKTNHSLFFSQNSNFCSFPSNSIFQTFSSFKNVCDIKGK